MTMELYLILQEPHSATNHKALAFAAAEKERVAKRTAEEAFDQVYSLKKSIRELDGIFNFLNLLFY